MSTDEPHVARTLLLVDDDHVFRGRLARAFSERGYDVRQARDAEEARQLAEQETPEFAVVDLRMPGSSGLEVVACLHALDPTTRVVVLTGYGSIATAVEAVKLGATHYLTKPADADDVELAFARGQASGDATLPIREEDAPSLARVEWEHIQRVLTDAGGNISVAAKRLGLHRRSLQRKLSKYPVSR